MFDLRVNDAAAKAKNALKGLLFGCLAAALVVAPARAQEEDDSPLLGGFSAFVEAAPHVVVQKTRGSVGTDFDLTSRKSNLITNMTFRLGGGLKGPAIAGIWGSPRPVVFAAALVPINESSTIGTNLVETASPGSEVIEFSKYSVEYQTSGMAGLGLEFTVPVLDSEITIMPAVQSLHLVTRFVGAGSLQVNTTGLTINNAIRAKEEVVQHYLGPALRVGTPTVTIKGVTVDFFLDTSLLIDVAGTRKEFRARGDGGESGTFTFEAGKGVAQVASGIQLRWP
jgi:hypothetical protein